ncbi:hypothetical protein D3C83_22070 [compost metagenome]
MVRIRAAHDDGELPQRRVAQAIVFEECIEAALLANVRERNVRNVVGNRIALPGRSQYLIGRHVQEFRMPVDEP